MYIVYATNAKYINLLIASIKSLEEHNSKLNITVLHDHLDDNTLHLIQNNVSSCIKFIKPNLQQFDSIFEKYDKNQSHLSKETFFRLLIPSVVEESIKKVLYLDVDTIIRKDLGELFDLDLKNFPFAAVPYYNSSPQKLKALNMSPESNYFNAGVLLINMPVIRKNKIFESITYKILNSNNFTNADQDALNSSVNGYFYKLNSSYNYTFTTTKNFRYDSATRIIHFAGKYKPDLCFYRHPYKREFRYYHIKIIGFQTQCKKSKEYLIKRLLDFLLLRNYLSKFSIIVRLKRFLIK